MALRDRVRRAQGRVGRPEMVYLKDGTTLSLGPDGRFSAFLATFEQHDSEDGETSDPLLRAILADEVDIEATLAAGTDPELGNALRLLYCLTAPVRDGDDDVVAE
jgi:hypothetical protein